MGWLVESGGWRVEGRRQCRSLERSETRSKLGWQKWVGDAEVGGDATVTSAINTELEIELCTARMSAGKTTNQRSGCWVGGGW